jgi:hypothetical protein
MTMTAPEPSIRMMCWPGPRAAAGVQTTPSGQLVLAVFLDPMNIVVTAPPFPTGAVVTATFLRQLARSALSMAGQLDPMESPSRSTGAHRADDTGMHSRGDLR